MINEENKEEIIEQYLEGTLSGELLQEFEAKMEKDPGFRREVALQRKIVRNVKTIGRRKDLRATLKNIHQEMLIEQQEEKGGGPVIPMPGSKVNYYAIAAAITLLIAAGVVFVWVYRTPDEPTLAFLPVEAIESDGISRGPRGMLNVMIFPSGDSLNSHYQFTDTLKLYGPFDVEEIKLYYNLDTDHYLLQANGNKYELQKSAAIMRLEEEE